MSLLSAEKILKLFSIKYTKKHNEIFNHFSYEIATLRPQWHIYPVFHTFILVFI